MRAAGKARVAAPYADSHELLADELRLLDLELGRRVAELRAESRAAPEESASHHLFVTDAEVDRLLARSPLQTPAAEPHRSRSGERLRAEIDARVEASEAAGVFLSLRHLERLFGLSPIERRLIVLCLAPELDRKYDRLYAYLQDDITRKRPSVDLALDLICRAAAERWQLRARFSERSPLFRAALLEPVEDPQSPSGSSDLARFLKLDRRVLDFLLDQPAIDRRLDGVARLLPPAGELDGVWVDPDLARRLLAFARHHLDRSRAEAGGVVVHLCGAHGVGKRRLARAVCAELGLPLLAVDGELLAADDSRLTERLRRAFREGLLQHAGVLIEGVDRLEAVPGHTGGGRVGGRLRRLSATAAELGGLTFLAGRRGWRRHDLFRDGPFLALELPLPAMELRRNAWRAMLDELPGPAPDGAAEILARRFRLAPGQIRGACREVAARRVGEREGAGASLDELAAACRRQSSRELADLAVKIEPRYRWRDLILPEARLSLLREICSQVEQRHRVLGDWGFGRKLSHGKGLAVLFSGPPGTGKTMAAEVMARELALDLYKVDLSGVVSKYIGETEKNLARIFQHAEAGNAILFFDEADALFGKRTEVSDAHDRYANIETSYLLQKMEEYEGMVILASNLRQNLDEAFVRRLRFIVELPFPETAGRREIWRSHLPAEAPRSAAIDFDFLAEKFAIAGGNIKNVVLNAAFLAAADGGEIAMDHLLRGTRREFEKIGKLWSDAYGEGA